MKEVTIEIREKGQISIQGAGVGEKQEELKSTLETALKALEKEPDQTFKNEIIYKKK